MRFCKKCGHETARNKQGGCKPCAISASAAWRAANPDKVKTASANYRAANMDKVRSAHATWCATNRDKARASATAWKKANPLSLAAYRAANIEKSRVRCINRRAIKRNAEGRHDEKDIAQLMELQKGKCACCRISIRNRYHVDHRYPLSKGGSNWPDNLQLLCPTCNTQKHVKHPIDFMQSKGFLL